MKRSAMALLVGLMSIGVVTVAVPATAQAEPITYSMECTSQSGNHFYIDTPSECSYGLIKFISSYDGKVAGKLDMYALQTGMKDSNISLSEAYHKCSSNVWCQIVVAAVDTVILKKVKIAWTWFRGVIG